MSFSSFECHLYVILDMNVRNGRQTFEAAGGLLRLQLADATLGIVRRDPERARVRFSAAETPCGMPTVFGRRPA